MSEVDQLQLLMDNTIKVKPTKKNAAAQPDSKAYQGD
jgi:hypothetical protein